ncbi:hemin ABC transporter substrate-binding protein [Brucella gallinifaecis]|uniref:heme/hemin ABC transporter substrate-binding protein n=1 Tax=Brucella gallinifaecis TaxID=215590 RepID=UPI0023630975|nr:ABC transporter substrate-binding protein [Brucella gallinifaecis]
MGQAIVRSSYQIAAIFLKLLFALLVIIAFQQKSVHAETKEANRIVSLGPDVTEIIFALGVGDKIVAVDRSSKYPAETATKTNVGYRRSLSPEGILTLDTDLIIASEDIGPPETTDVLNQSAVEILYIPVDNSRAGLVKKIKLIAKRLDLEKEGDALTQKVIDDFDAATAYASKISADKQKKVVFFHGLARLSGAGSDTAADAFIRYAGGINPLSIYSGYKPVSEEWLVKAEPDVVLMLSDGNGGPTREDVFSHKALQQTPAAKSQSLVVLEGPYMLGFGPRTAEAIRKLATALYE